MTRKCILTQEGQIKIDRVTSVYALVVTCTGYFNQNLKKESRPINSADVLDELFHPTYDCLAGLDVCLR
jgi:hypothetical protein